MAEAEKKAQNYNIPGMRGPRSPITYEKADNGKETILRLMAYFAKQKNLMLGLTGAVIVVVCCMVYAPRLQSGTIDLITQGDFQGLNKVLMIMLVLYVIHGAVTYAQSLCSARLSQAVVEKLREDLFRKIVHLPIAYLDRHSHGDIMSRMTNDVENISNMISQSMSSLVSGVLTISGTVIMMVWICPQLALLSCVTVILTIFATRYLSGAMKNFFSKRQELLGQINGTVEEMVTGYKTVVAYNRQEAVLNDFRQTSDELTKAGIIAEILSGSMGPVMNVINNIGFVIIAAFGGYFAIKGVISVGTISAFIVYARQFGRPIEELAQIYGQIQTALAGAERVFALMDEPSEDQRGNKIMDDAIGTVTFENVHFSYVPGKEVLHGFDFDVRAGHKIALVGATGSGKTTVVNLLMRFYQPDSGAIKIDGVDIRDISCDNLRKNIAIVLQDTVLFSDTVENIIRYSNPEAGWKELDEAVRLSYCTELIRHLPDKMNTMLTEGGQNLSQGQRQLLSIARAFLADPRILILDEATSSVDTRTEKHIQDAMVNLMKDRTSLIIAHRISTIQDADCIVVMDEGRIAEIGNHEELLRQKGKYYELYMTQFAGNIT
ncbi:MAG: ABC transporter ATP-binding protein [Lachnospiraceae bacterium]|nr:ABC transporter ATP-binding protein [Lachnospiraceae bacterium]